jgi:hypothetical protein
MTAPDAPGPARPAPGEVAAYISKYSTKTIDPRVTLDHAQGDELDGDERGTA